MSLYRNNVTNIRNDAQFSTKLYSDVYWVPYNCLGKSFLTEELLMNICDYSSKDLYKKLHNPCELVQFIQNCFFDKCLGVYYKQDDSYTWELHDSAELLIKNKSGSCAAYAGLFYEILKNWYDKVYCLCIVTKDCKGHAINYIETKDGELYFFDLSSQIRQYISLLPVETGNIKDFVKSKIVTGVALKATNIQSFVKYFEKFHLLRNKEFLYYIVQSDTIPGIAYVEKSPGITEIVLKQSQIVSVYEKDDFSENFYFKLL